YDGFTKKEKYESMSSSRPHADITDISMVLASGPLTLNAGDSTRVSFALIGGDSLAGLFSEADRAQVKYDSITAVIPIPGASAFTLIAYPVPFDNDCILQYVLPEPSKPEITIFDIAGRKILTLSEGIQSQGMHEVKLSAQGWSSGIYVCELKAGERIIRKRLVVQ